jgi:hypothetical protein
MSQVNTHRSLFLPLTLLTIVASIPFATTACDMLKKQDAPDAAPVAVAPTPPPPVAVAPDAAPLSAPSVIPLQPPRTPPSRTVKLPDGGTAVVAVTDGGAGTTPFTFPSGFPTALPSGFPTALPSGFPTALPSGFPTALPSGFPTLPTNKPDAK